MRNTGVIVCRCCVANSREQEADGASSEAEAPLSGWLRPLLEVRGRHTPDVVAVPSDLECSDLADQFVSY
jgi:hypothetical protein